MSRLQLADYFHRPDLRSTCYRPRRETRRQRIKAIKVITQTRAQAGYQMLYVRIAFDDHQLLNLDRSVIRNPTEVVAAKVDQHRVFGNFLFVAAHLLTQPTVFGFSRAALSRAGYWTVV